MKAFIKDLSVAMEIKNKGVEIDVSNNADEHLGDLVVTKTKLVWCSGKTPVRNGKSVTWEEFIEFMNSR